MPGTDQVKLNPTVLEAAKSGHLPQLQAELADFKYNITESKTDVFEYPEEATTLIRTACDAHQVETVRWLINERFPNWRPFLHSHLAAVIDPAIYDVFLTRWPELMNMDLGHNGNPLGLNVFGGNKDMVKYLLDKGVDPNTAQYSGRYFTESRTLRTFGRDVPDDIFELLIAHGFVVPADVEWPRKKPTTSRCTIV